MAHYLLWGWSEHLVTRVDSAHSASTHGLLVILDRSDSGVGASVSTQELIWVHFPYVMLVIGPCLEIYPVDTFPRGRGFQSHVRQCLYLWTYKTLNFGAIIICFSLRFMAKLTEILLLKLWLLMEVFKIQIRKMQTIVGYS